MENRLLLSLLLTTLLALSRGRWATWGYRISRLNNVYTNTQKGEVQVCFENMVFLC